MAQAEVSGGLASVSPTGLVRPKADGEGQVTFTLAGQVARRAGESQRARRPPTR